MPPTLENRVSGDILIPLEFNPDPKLALIYARMLSDLFQLGITIITDSKNETKDPGLKFNEIRIKEPFSKWLAKRKEEYSFIIINSIPYRETSDKEEVKAKTELLIRDSMVPVLSVCGKPIHEKLNQLLLPFDLTRESTQKLSKAIDFSAADNKILIQVISVLFSVDDFVINKLTRQIEEVRFSLEQKGVLCSAELVKTDEMETHGEVVSEIADRNKVDLVMIMSQVESDEPGSPLHKDVIDIINRCPAPVLTINPRI